MHQRNAGYIDVHIGTSIFKGYEIALNSLSLNRNSFGMVNDAKLKTTIFLLKQEGYSTDFMSNMLTLLTFIVFAFYVSDFSVYYIIDPTKDSETIQKQLDEVKKVILSNGPVLYTLSLPFIVYFLSQKPQISLPTAYNIPLFVGLLMTMYLFTHFIAIAVRNWYKEADFHFMYHVANFVALLLPLALIVIPTILETHMILPIKIVLVTYLFLLFRNISSLIVYYAIIKKGLQQTRKVVYVP